ncbi:MAG: hypothetical protein Kow0068_07300 [Marinilabiliales bacterium]
MITRIVKMEINEADIDSYLEKVQSVLDKIKSFDGCVSINILNDKEVSNRFFSYSTWESEEKLDAYRNSEWFKQIWSEIRQYFKSPAQAWMVVDAIRE